MFLGATVDVQPLYSVVWPNDWPSIKNQHLLHIRQFDPHMAKNKVIKLKITQSLKKFKQSSLSCREPNKSPISPDITKNNYNNAALSIDLNGICPSIYSSSSLILEPGSMVKEEEAIHSQSPFQATSHLDPHSEKIDIKKCVTCKKLLSICECKIRCNNCYHEKCTCTTICTLAINTSANTLILKSQMQ